MQSVERHVKGAAASPKNVRPYTTQPFNNVIEEGVPINKTLKKSLLVGGVISTVGIGSLLSVGLASAATDSSTGSLVDKLASRFNLNRSDVQKVFDEDRAAHDAGRQAKLSERLQKLVSDGTITANQKTAIEAKLKELQANRESNRDTMKNLSDDERKAKMDEERTALDDWAKAQGLDLTKLRGIFMGGHGHGGPGGPDGWGGPPPDANI